MYFKWLELTIRMYFHCDRGRTESSTTPAEWDQDSAGLTQVRQRHKSTKKHIQFCTSTQASSAILLFLSNSWPLTLPTTRGQFFELTAASLLSAVGSVSPRRLLLDSSAPAASPQIADPRTAKKKLAFVLECEKQQWRQTARRSEKEQKCKPVNSVIMKVPHAHSATAVFKTGLFLQFHGYLFN